MPAWNASDPLPTGWDRVEGRAAGQCKGIWHWSEQGGDHADWTAPGYAGEQNYKTIKYTQF